MALSVPFVGSGEFVHVREWSCPLHDKPQTHECDCELCKVPEVTCPSCVDADWVDVLGDDGVPVTRELSKWEVGMRRTVLENFQAEAALLCAMSDRPNIRHYWTEQS